MMDRQPEAEGGDRRSVPERLGPYLYYTRRDDGKDFPLYVRRPAEGGTLRDEQVVRPLEFSRFTFSAILWCRFE